MYPFWTFQSEVDLNTQIHLKLILDIMLLENKYNPADSIFLCKLSLNPLCLNPVCFLWRSNWIWPSVWLVQFLLSYITEKNFLHRPPHVYGVETYLFSLQSPRSKFCQDQHYSLNPMNIYIAIKFSRLISYWHCNKSPAVTPQSIGIFGFVQFKVHWVISESEMHLVTPRI